MMVFGSGFSVYLTKLILLCGKKERSPESLYLCVVYVFLFNVLVYVVFTYIDSNI